MSEVVIFVIPFVLLVVLDYISTKKKFGKYVL